MDRRSLPQSRLASATFARELLCLNIAGPMLNITSQRQDPEILNFCYKSILRRIGRMLRPLLPMFRSDLSVYIAKKQVPVKLKPIVGPVW